MTGCVEGRGGTAEEEQDPWREEGGHQGLEAAWGEHGRDEEEEGEEDHLEESEEGTSSLVAEGPT